MKTFVRDLRCGEKKTPKPEFPKLVQSLASGNIYIAVSSVSVICVVPKDNMQVGHSFNPYSWSEYQDLHPAITVCLTNGDQT